MVRLVVVLDQRQSRARGDEAAPALLAAAASVPAELPFRRTLGDEIQGLPQEGTAFADVVELAAEAGEWWIGVGVGPVERLGPSVLESTGTAFALAREAVEEAKGRPWGAAVRGGDWEALLDGALALHLSLLASRTAPGWEAIRLKRDGLADEEIGARLGVTRQAVAKRLRAARYREGELGRGLVAALADAAFAEAPAPPPRA